MKSLAGKLLLGISLVLMIASCAHNKIRFVRKAPRTVVAVDETPDQRQKEKEFVFNQTSVTVQSESEVVEEEMIPADLEIESIDNVVLSTRPVPQDSTENSAFTKEQKQAAMNAEDNAKSAVLLFSFSFLASIMIFPLAIFLIAFGWHKYNLSKKSVYSTPNGVRKEKQALLLGVLSILFFVALIVLAVVLIIIML